MDSPLLFVRRAFQDVHSLYELWETSPSSVAIFLLRLSSSARVSLLCFYAFNRNMNNFSTVRMRCGVHRALSRVRAASIAYSSSWEGKIEKFCGVRMFAVQAECMVWVAEIHRQQPSQCNAVFAKRVGDWYMHTYTQHLLLIRIFI